jgi:hypothetical protein
MNKFKQWMKESTTAEKQAVSIMADASIQHLYDIAADRRNASADLAGRIETAILAVNRRKREQPLPVVGRGDISSACANCSFYKGCK